MLALHLCECTEKPGYARLVYPGGPAVGCTHCGRPRGDLLAELHPDDDRLPATEKPEAP